MRRITFILLILFAAQFIFAEGEGEEKKDTLWTPKGVVGINLSQVAFSNWSQGGENTLAYTFFTLFGLDYIGDPWKWKNSLKFTYGRTKFGDQGYRQKKFCVGHEFNGLYCIHSSVLRFWFYHTFIFK